MEENSIIQSLLEILFPKEIASHFTVKEVKEDKTAVTICLEELSELVPKALEGASKEIVLDGFCNPLELQSFPLKGKSVYLKLYRRRWKEAGSDTHYSNTYNFQPEGVKATKEFASFLKEAYGHTPDQYNSFIRSLLRRKP